MVICAFEGFNCQRFHIDVDTTPTTTHPPTTPTTPPTTTTHPYTPPPTTTSPTHLHTTTHSIRPSHHPSRQRPHSISHCPPHHQTRPMAPPLTIPFLHGAPNSRCTAPRGGPPDSACGGAECGYGTGTSEQGGGFAYDRRGGDMQVGHD